MVIPLIHHKNGGFTELKVVGVWALNYPFVYSIFSWCAKGIVIIHNSQFMIIGMNSRMLC
ncbi:MAG: hypothetical protein E7493_01960 [Ruminococcus albus]|nr:hypothetical protein [Ruminococcus albus]